MAFLFWFFFTLLLPGNVWQTKPTLTSFLVHVKLNSQNKQCLRDGQVKYTGIQHLSASVSYMSFIIQDPSVLPAAKPHGLVMNNVEHSGLIGNMVAASFSINTLNSINLVILRRAQLALV